MRPDGSTTGRAISHSWFLLRLLPVAVMKKAENKWRRKERKKKKKKKKGTCKLDFSRTWLLASQLLGMPLVSEHLAAVLCFWEKGSSSLFVPAEGLGLKPVTILQVETGQLQTVRFPFCVLAATSLPFFNIISLVKSFVIVLY